MKRPKCPVCSEVMYTVFIKKNGGNHIKVGYYCKFCDKIYREVFIGLKKINLKRGCNWILS
ncbi:hypothetical protein ES702_06208 [subsurface metagenome]